MAKFWSPSRNGFFDDALHGARTKLVPDPRWERPTIADPDWVAPKIPDPAWTPPAEPIDGEPVPMVAVREEAPLIADPDAVAPKVPDMSAEHPLIEVANEDCKLPGDAVAITDQLYAALIFAQSNGLQITTGASGLPIASERAAPSDEQLAARAREVRAARLRESDWTALLDVALSDAERTAWAVYRKALRDVSNQTGWPRTIEWPTPPAKG